MSVAQRCGGQGFLQIFNPNYKQQHYYCYSQHQLIMKQSNRQISVFFLTKENSAGKDSVIYRQGNQPCHNWGVGRGERLNSDLYLSTGTHQTNSQTVSHAHFLRQYPNEDGNTHKHTKNTHIDEQTCTHHFPQP